MLPLPNTTTAICLDPAESLLLCIETIFQVTETIDFLGGHQFDSAEFSRCTTVEVVGQLCNCLPPDGYTSRIWTASDDWSFDK